MSIVPSAFAQTAHESRSDRYAYIPTMEVIDGMRDEGFAPVFAKQGTSRIEGKADYTKHLIRFRWQGEGASLTRVGDTLPEVVLVNSHDGTSAYKIMAGLIRLACLNGLIVSEGELTSVSVPHKGNVVDQVIDGSYTVLEASKNALAVASEWSGKTLNRDEETAFAEAAHILRFGDETGEVSTPIQPEQLLLPRRRDDVGTDLWRTFNRVQENMIRGGLRARGRDAQNRPRTTTTRAIKGIDQDVRLNRALWLLGERLAGFKHAA